jgi:hypothetical protein
MGMGGVLTTERLIAGRQQWEVANQERGKEWVKEREGGGERENIQSGTEGEREEENEKGRYFESYEKNK